MKSILLFFIAIPLLFLAACSDPQNAPTAANEKVSAHEPGWNLPAAAAFHGKILASKNFDARECRQCHGSQYEGGITNVSCKTCHTSYPHPAGFVGAHSSFIKSINYNLNSCKSCHGQNYGTVKANISCLTCHNKQGGPEACNTCHGNFSGDATDLKTSAPPRGLNGETSPTAPAVGGHQAHLPADKSLAAAACQQCHALPQSFAAAGHIDADGKADLIFSDALARLKTEGGARAPNVVYNATANTCAGSYCHGNWGLLKSQSQYAFIYTADKMEGINAAPKWTDSASAACGTCHGNPPVGHQPHDLTRCFVCHAGVVDENGKISDKTKHINGKVNAFGQEYPMF
jgi:predicted CxxxxCH...CXXCH cytochrome family protein